MQFEDAHLDEREEPLGGVDGAVRLASRVLLHLDAPDGFRNVLVDVLLIEALFGAALRAADQGEGTVGDPGKDPVGDALVIERQIAFGHSLLGKEDLVGAAQLHTREL